MDAPKKSSKAALILALGKPGSDKEEGSDEGEDVSGEGKRALAKAVRSALESKDDEALASALEDFCASIDAD
jgi:hypothetical protein